MPRPKGSKNYSAREQQMVADRAADRAKATRKIESLKSQLAAEKAKKK